VDAGILLAAGTGLVAGTVHVLGGVDHVAAVLPLSAARGRGAWVLGVRWGAGHAAGVVAVGLLAVVLRERLDLGVVEPWAERLVGATLLAIGGLSLRAALRTRIHAHEHAHDGAPHVHLHVHGGGAHAPGSAGGAHAHGHAAVLAGILHGVAGSSHLLGVLPAVSLATAGASTAYLGGFGLGTVAAMAAFAHLVGAGSARWGGRAPLVARRMMVSASCATLLVGAAWLATS